MKTSKYTSFYTPMGLVNIEHLAHGSLHLEWEGMHLYVDPCSDFFDYTGCKKADFILLTHAHTDHYDTKAIEEIAMPNTTFVVSPAVKTCLEYDLIAMKRGGYKDPDGKEWPKLDLDNNPLNVDPSTNLVNMLAIPKLRHCKVIALDNGESFSSIGITITAVPAYNIVRKRENGHPFHIKGQGNGYILAMQGFEFYFAGDTELIPEMEELSPTALRKSDWAKKIQDEIDVAFLPKNLPYTMSDEEFVKAANLIKPKNLFPIHYFEMDAAALRKNLDTGICLYVDGKQVF